MTTLNKLYYLLDALKNIPISELINKIKFFILFSNDLFKHQISLALQHYSIVNKLYVKLFWSMVSILNFYPTFVLLPIDTIKQLIESKIKIFYNTIYIDHEYIMSLWLGVSGVFY